MAKKKRKSLVGWLNKDWRKDFKFAYRNNAFSGCAIITPLARSRPKKILYIPKDNVSKVRITIEEI